MCFDWTWWEHLLIWIIVAGAVIGILRLLLPMVFANLGAPGATLQGVLNIILWAVVAIFVVWIAFDLISCLASGGGGFSLGLGPRR